VAKVDLRGRRVGGNQSDEENGRNAPDKPRGRAQTGYGQSDGKTGSPNNWHGRVASIHGLDRQEIDQGISTTQQHGSSSSYAIRRSMRSPASYSGCLAPTFASARGHAALSGGNRSIRALSARSAGRSPTLRPSLRRLTRKTSPQLRPASQRRARRAPASQGPQRSGRSYPP